AAASDLNDTPWRTAISLSVSPGATRYPPPPEAAGAELVPGEEGAGLTGGGHRARRQVVGIGDAPERFAGGNRVSGRHRRRGHQGARGHRGQQGTEHGALPTTGAPILTGAARCSVNLQAALHLRFS